MRAFFATHQDRLVKEMAAEGITTMAADRYLEAVYSPAFNTWFARPARGSGTAFVPLVDIPLANILCEHFERTVGSDLGEALRRLRRQGPADPPGSIPDA